MNALILLFTAPLKPVTDWEHRTAKSRNCIMRIVTDIEANQPMILFETRSAGLDLTHPDIQISRFSDFQLPVLAYEMNFAF